MDHRSIILGNVDFQQRQMARHDDDTTPLVFEEAHLAASMPERVSLRRSDIAHVRCVAFAVLRMADRYHVDRTNRAAVFQIGLYTLQTLSLCSARSATRSQGRKQQ